MRIPPPIWGASSPRWSLAEVFDRFEGSLASGERSWDQTSPTGSPRSPAPAPPSMPRLIPGRAGAGAWATGKRLAAGCRVVDSACGAGVEIVRLAEAYPACQVVGVDGDGHSIDQARERVADAGLADRVSLVCSPLEALRLDQPATAVINNISMHECRDIDLVTANVLVALEPGGWFVISDFPIPDTDKDCAASLVGSCTASRSSSPRSTTSCSPAPTTTTCSTGTASPTSASSACTPMHAVTYGRRREDGVPPPARSRWRTKVHRLAARTIRSSTPIRPAPPPASAGPVGPRHPVLRLRWPLGTGLRAARAARPPRSLRPRLLQPHPHARVPTLAGQREQKAIG